MFYTQYADRVARRLISSLEFARLRLTRPYPLVSGVGIVLPWGLAGVFAVLIGLPLASFHCLERPAMRRLRAGSAAARPRVLSAP